MVLAIKEDLAVAKGWGLETVCETFVPVDLPKEAKDQPVGDLEDTAQLILAGFLPRYARWDSDAKVLRSGNAPDIDPPGLAFALQLSTTEDQVSDEVPKLDQGPETSVLYPCPVYSTRFRQNVVMTIELPCSPDDLNLLKRQGACAVLHY